MFSILLPNPNTGLGFHYFPNDAHYRATDLHLWLPELKSLGASWLTLVGSPARAIPESFLRPLIEAGIEPIIHLPARPAQVVDLEALQVLYQSYARWGVHYVALYDQPNTRAAWRPDQWGREGLINHFLDLLIPALQMAQANGLTPVFPPLKQLGDYWDTSFLDSALTLLRQRGQGHLLKDLVFGCYGFTGNRPLEWGAGGPARWPESHPYNTPPGSQNQGGFRAFEWYADSIRAHLGEPRPLLMLAGGARPGDADDPGFPPVDESWHASCNTSIAMAMMEQTLPAYLMNVSFWLLAADADSPHAPAAWRRSDGTALPALEALRAHRAKAANLNEKPLFQRPPAPSRLSDWPIHHYLLLPAIERSDENWHLLAALDYVRKFQPTCGFSAGEAKAAEHVTIVGDEQGVSAETEHALRAAGCRVERVCGADGSETGRRLSEMAKADRRFLAESSEVSL